MKSYDLAGLLIAAVVVLAGCTDKEQQENRRANLQNDKEKVESISESSLSGQEKWQKSPYFEITNHEGHGTYVLIGRKDKLAFIVDAVPSAAEGEQKVTSIVAGKVQKYMWLFWGSPQQLAGPLKVVGVDENGKKHQVLFQDGKSVWQYTGRALAGENLGADAHSPSLMRFAHPGLWKLNVYLNGKFFGDVVVEVQEQNHT